MSDKRTPPADGTYPEKISPRPLLISSKVKREVNPIISLPETQKAQPAGPVGTLMQPPIRGGETEQSFPAPPLARVNLKEDKVEETPQELESTDERYDLFETLGEGVVGVVSKARDLASGRWVAVKNIRPQFLPDAESRIRFRSKIRALSLLQHPHILPIFDVGSFNGSLRFAMPIADGGSVLTDLRQRKRVFKKTARLLSQVAHALDFAHRRGHLHGNLKPANILIDQNNHPFIADFGLAPADLYPAQSATLSKDGTLPYLAPEKLDGKPTTVASDIYSLGAILYEMLTSHAPFSDVLPDEVLQKKQNELPESPRSLDRTIPPDLELICLKCLAIQPDDRYPTANALADDLENWLGKRPLSLRESSILEILWKWMRRNPVSGSLFSLISITLTIAAIASTFGWILLSHEEKQTQTAVSDLREQLWRSALGQAQAARQSLSAGRVSHSLEAIRTAANIRISPELRTEAAASLATADLRVSRQWSIRTTPEPLPVLFSPDLKLTFRATTDGSFEILATDDQRFLGRIRSKTEDPITAIAPLMSYGHLVATRCASGTIRVWESVAPGAIVFELPGEPASPLYPWEKINFAVDPAGLLAVGQADGRIALYELVLRSPARFISSGEKITHLAFDPSGRHLAIVRENRAEIEIIDPAKPDEPPLVLQQESPIALLAWSPDSRQIAAAGADGLISIWQAETGKFTAVLPSNRSGVVSQLLFTHSGTHLATTGSDLMIRLWNIAAKTEECRLDGFGGEPVMRFSPDDKRLLATDYSTTGVELEVTLPQICNTHAPLVADDSVPAVGMDFSHDHQYLAVTTQATLQVRDIQNGRLLASEISTSRPGPAWTAAFAPFSQSLYIKQRAADLGRRSIQRTAEGFSLGSEEHLAVVPGFDITGFNTGGTLLGLVRPGTGTAQFFNPANLKILSAAQVDSARDLVGSPSGSQFFVIGTVLTIFNAGDGKKLREFDIGGGGTAAWSPDGKWMIASGSKGTQIWSANDWSPGPELGKDVASRGKFPAWSPNGRLLAVSVGDKVAIHDARDLSLLLNLHGPVLPSINPRLKFSRDSQRLALLGSDGALQLWHLEPLRKALKNQGLDW